MLKEFEDWHIIKSDIHEREPNHSQSKDLSVGNPPVIYFHPREIWWCYLGMNVGFEENGKNEQFSRPVLVVKKFNHNILWALPLTSTKKDNHPYYAVYTAIEPDIIPEINGNVLDTTTNSQKDGSIIVSQLRLIDARRLTRKMGMLPISDFEVVKRKLKKILYTL